MSNLIKVSIDDQIKNYKDDLINECLVSRILDPTIIDGSNNYFVDSKHTKTLYDVLINVCSKYFNFTIKDNDFKLWCYYSDDKFNGAKWHNHINTCTINAVLYLKIPKDNKGIDFRHNDKIINCKPKPGDLIIFPNFLDHYAYPSHNEPRISLNLELRCHEDSNDIFNNLKVKP